MWTQEQAIALCRAVEKHAPEFGCHVALTGGLLYKDGERKDCDLVFYRIRQVEEIDVDGLFRRLAELGITRITEGESFVIEAKHEHGPIDCLFPDLEGDYEPDEDEAEKPLPLQLAEALSQRTAELKHWPDCAMNHGGAACDMGPECGSDDVQPRAEPMAVVGVATFTGRAFTLQAPPPRDATGRAWFCGPFGFEIDTAESLALAEPVPCRGALGFWTLPADVAARVEAQLR